MKTRTSNFAVLILAMFAPAVCLAADYVIDTEQGHAFIQFRIQHLGYSWLLGRFNDFDGEFSYDPEKPEDSRVEVRIRTASIDSAHAERDKHLRGEDFLAVEQYPEARFVSTSYRENDDNTATLIGDLSLHGVTRSVSIEVRQVGHGPDPWGGYRRGFEGTTTLRLSNFGIDYDLGPAAREVELFLSIEGVRQ